MASKPNLNVAVWLLLEVLYILSLTVKHTRQRWLFFIAILSISAYALAFYKMDFRHLGLGERGLSSRLPILVSFASSNLLLCDPHKELRFIGQKPTNISDAPFLSRCWWALLVWANPRGINFAHEPTTHLPPRPRQKTCTNFVLAQLRSILLFLLLLDLVGTMNRANPYYTKGIPVVVGMQRLWWFAGFGFAAAIWILMSIQFMSIAILLVILGVSSPSDCPVLFGSPFEGYTLRRIWGKFWHQLIRRPCVTHGDFAVRVLRVPQNSRAAIICKLIVGFLLSGIIHYISEAVVAESLTEPLGCFGFFLLQVVAILFEEYVIKAARTLGLATRSTRWTKLIGYVWVLLWVDFSLPYWTAAGYRAGWTEEIPQFSFVLGVWKGQWFPPNKPTL